MDQAGRADVCAGAVYERHERTQTEIAEVLDVRRDISGIPHVRFRLEVARRYGGANRAEVRTLALSAFSSRYVEPRAR